MFNGKPLKFCKSIKYLGHVITDTLEDNGDVMRQATSIYARVKLIINTLKSVLKMLNVINTKHIYIKLLYLRLCCNYTKQVIINPRWHMIIHLECFFNVDRFFNVSDEMNQ